MLFLKNGLWIDDSVRRSTFRRKNVSNWSHSSSNLSPRSMGSFESISTSRSISLAFSSNLPVTDDPKAYKYLTLWFLQRRINRFRSFDIWSLIIIIQRYKIFYCSQCGSGIKCYIVLRSCGRTGLFAQGSERSAQGFLILSLCPTPLALCLTCPILSGFVHFCPILSDLL